MVSRKIKRFHIGFSIILSISLTNVFAQADTLVNEVERAMLASTKFMVNEVSNNGGYVWFYLPDLSRRWGEMEAYKSMIWIQNGGTVSIGHMFLDAYHVTKNLYYYDAAKKAAAALIWGQSEDGGWNYMIDFAGKESLRTWYNTIGKNGWRLEEFQHYDENDTYDDDVTSNAARFILRMYLESGDPIYKLSLDKAINFIVRSQYPNGGWPQRYPLKYGLNKIGHNDYSSYYTFNDDVIWENLNFLIECYLGLGEEQLLDPIRKSMDFYLISQSENGAWGQQYTMEMEVAGARTYEPAAYLPSTTYKNALLLLKFYQYTGNRSFISQVPKAIEWINRVQLPIEKTESGRYTHPTFVDKRTNKPVYVHRRGSNVKYGYYYTDTIDKMLLQHYYGKTRIPIQNLKDEYERINSLSDEEVLNDSPFFMAPTQRIKALNKILSRNRFAHSSISDDKIKEIIAALDKNNRWLVKHVMISNPYVGDGVKSELTDKFASTNVGDETDTSPYRDPTDQLYISTPEYIKNMYLLMMYMEKFRN